MQSTAREYAHDNRWPLDRLRRVLEMWPLFQERYLDVAENLAPGDFACQPPGRLAGRRVAARTVGKKDDSDGLGRETVFARHMRGAIGKQLRQARIETERRKDVDGAVLSVCLVQYLHKAIPGEIAVGREQRIDDDLAGGERSERLGDRRRAVDENTNQLLHLSKQVRFARDCGRSIGAAPAPKDS
jgi:hypothetical protein